MCCTKVSKYVMSVGTLILPPLKFLMYETGDLTCLFQGNLTQ